MSTIRTLKLAPSGYPVVAEVVAGDRPPVVLVNAQGTARSQWDTVLRLLTTRSTVVTYDRPGIGHSPPRPAPNPSLPYSAFAAELATMLHRLDVTEPAVLVGHSFGSLLVRAYAARHPERVAGMVHIDGSLPRLNLWPGSGPTADGDRPDATEVDATSGAAELASAVFPSRPGIVLACTPGRWAVRLPDPAVDGVWQRTQADLARDTGAALVVATDAGHEIPKEAPALVAWAVNEVVSAVRCSRDVVEVDADRLTAVGGRLAAGGNAAE